MGEYLKYIWAVVALVFLYVLSKWFGISIKPTDKKRDVANLLYDCMQDQGTRFDDMYKALESLSSNELKGVYDEFGSRNYRDMGILGGGSWPEGLGGVPLDLFGWFSAELLPWQKGKMRDIWFKSRLLITF